MANIYVRDFKTRSIVHTVNVTGKSWRQVEKIELGMLCNMNQEEYFVDDDEAFSELNPIDLTDEHFGQRLFEWSAKHNIVLKELFGYVTVEDFLDAILNDKPLERSLTT